MFTHGGSSIVIVNDDLVLVRRCGKKWIQLIGGKAKNGESPVDTVMRETREETGICLEISKLAIMHEAFFVGNETYSAHSFFLYRTNASISKKNKKRLVWMPIRDLAKGKKFGWWSYKKAVRVAERIFSEGAC